jgi:YVTN family beta-propeller protein
MKPWEKAMRVLTLLMLAGLSLGSTLAMADNSYHINRKLSLEGDGGWDLLSTDSSAHRLYLSHADHVLVVDTVSGKAVGTIGDTPGVHGIALDTVHGMGYISCGKADAVKVFDLKTLKPLATIPVGANPDVIMLEPKTGHVLTFNGHASSISVIDTGSNKVVDTIALPGKPELGHADDQGHVYINLEDRSAMAVLDVQSGKVTTWPLAPCDSPSGLAMDVAHRRLFSVCDNQLMTVSNADTGKVITTLPIGHGPDGAEFDPATQLVFSPNGADGTLTVVKEIDADHYQVVQTLPTQRGARTVALDPDTHLLYLPTAQFGERPAGSDPHKRPPVLPGTFTVLEISPGQ